MGKSATRSSTQCLTFGQCLLGLIILGTAAVVIWRIFYLQERVYDIYQCMKNSDNRNVTDQYPHYFRAPDEQRDLMMKLGVYKPGVASDSYQANDSCGFQCPWLTLFPNRRTKRSEAIADYQNFPSKSRRAAVADGVNQDDTEILGIINHHACCTSQHKSVAPERATNVKDVERRLVQFKHIKQYYMSESCLHNSGCSMGCQCMQPDDYIFRAIVYKDNGGFEVDDIRIPGCCKCMNYLT